MVKKILGTIGTRFINALLAFLVVVLTTRYLGSVNYGTISLILLTVAIIQLANSFIAGGALIYMAPRAGAFRLFIPAYIWTLVITVASVGLIHLIELSFTSFRIIPAGYIYPVLFLSLLMSFVSVNSMLLLGLERVHAFNLLNLLQVVIHVLILLSAYFVFNYREVMAYYWALFTSYAVAFLISLWLLAPSLKPESFRGLKGLLIEIFRFGSYVQVANIFQQLNYRLSYYFVEAFIGRGAVGVLSAGVSMAEGLWLIARSISMVLFSRISNQMNDAYSIKLTMSMAKITWIVTLMALLLLLLFPNAAFEALFGRDFSGIRPVIASLGVGIVVLSMSMIFSGFFSGYNQPYHNTISSAIGVVFTIGLGLLLIPRLGIIGAGLTATVSYIASTIYQFYVFSRIGHFKLRDFLITREELRQIKLEMVKTLTRTAKP